MNELVITPAPKPENSTYEEFYGWQKDLYRGILHRFAVYVTFQKADGSKRTMFCTLRHADLPQRPLQPDGTYKKWEEGSLEVLPVWDLEKKAWRSFRIDSVESFKVDLEYGDTIW